MPLFKKKPEITELEAASAYVQFMAEETNKTWPNLYESLKKGETRDLLNSLEEPEFSVEDENQAIFDLALAAIGVNTQALKNILPEQNADRIYQWVLRLLNDPELNAPDLRGYGGNEVLEYGKAFNKSPTEAVADRLMHRWLGKNISNYYVKIDGQDTGMTSPLLVMSVQAMILPLCLSWS